MNVSAYVDRRLDARSLHAFDQHVAVCLVCRHAADEERRILTSLRSGPTPGFSPSLRSMLLALAEPSTADTARSAGSAGSAGGAGRAASAGAREPQPLSLLLDGPEAGQAHRRPAPPIPAAPESVRQLRVPTVPPKAPALHRSPRRAALIAGLAAGASAAAAIGLAVVGPGSGTTAVVQQAVPRTPGTTATAVPAAFGSPDSSPLQHALNRPGR